jgi:hypothetical protein
MLKVHIVQILLLPLAIQAQLTPSLIPRLDSDGDTCNSNYMQDQFHASCSNNEYAWNGIQSFAQITTATSVGYGQAFTLTTGVPLTDTRVLTEETVSITPDYSLSPISSVYGGGEKTLLSIVTTRVTASTESYLLSATQTPSTSPDISTAFLTALSATSSISTSLLLSSLPSTTTLRAAADSLSVGGKFYALGIMVAVGFLAKDFE